MILLRHLLSPAYLYAQNPTLMGSWPVGVIVALGVLMLCAGASVWRLRTTQRAGSRLSAHVALGAAVVGVVTMGTHVYAAGALSARVWYLSALFSAVLATICAWLPAPQSPVLSRALEALSLGLDPRDAPLGRGATLILPGLHITVLFGLARWAGAAPALVALLCLGAASSVSSRRLALRIEVLTPLLLTGVGELARWLVGDLLGVEIALYGAFAYPDPWSLWFDPRITLALGLGWTLLITGALLWRARTGLGQARSGLGLALLVLSLGWYLAVVVQSLSHGAAGSDPFCYLQMADDLAWRGTALHPFPLADLARQADVPLWPVAHVGYYPPFADNLAATVWPIGWPLLLVPFLRVGGEALALCAAPLCALLAAILTALMVRRMWPTARTGGWLAGGLAAALLITSDEGIRRSLVPMADAAAQLLAVATLLALVESVRSRRIVWSALAGAALAGAYWVRHPLLPLGFAAVAAVLVMDAPWKRRAAHAVAFGGVALLLALPDLAYHHAVFGSPWTAESPEWHLIAWRYIPDMLMAMARDGAFLRPEFGYLWPLILLGLWRQSAARSTRRWAWVLVAGFLPTLLFNLAYSALRYRDLISILPWFAIWAGWGAAHLWDDASQRMSSAARVVTLGLVLLLLSARTAPTLDLRTWQQPRIFGYVSRIHRQEFDRLADALPPGAVVATGLGSGAVARYTGHDTMRPYYWSDAEFQRIVAAAQLQGRPVYLLDDGEEMDVVLQRGRETLSLQELVRFDLPTYGLGGQDYGRPAVLYAIGQ
jgi:hypothetical protein